jgi:hypothetical protein
MNSIALFCSKKFAKIRKIEIKKLAKYRDIDFGEKKVMI